MIEKCKAKRHPWEVVFINLQKAFDRIPRGLVWQALRAQGVPEAYLELVKDMYPDATTEMTTKAGISKPFKVEVGVHQGSVLSPLLFTTVIHHIAQKVETDLPWELFFADDLAIVQETVSKVEDKVDAWNDVFNAAGFNINVKKTEHMRIGETDEGGSVHIGDDELMKLERIRNDVIRKCLGVAKIEEKTENLDSDGSDILREKRRHT